MAARNPYCVRRLPEEWSEWVELLTPVLDSRYAWRLPIVLAGLLLARGRRTVTTWLRAQGVLHDFDDYYYFLARLGRKIEPWATRLFQLLLLRLPTGERIVLALDDTPTRRYGPKVEGAGLHHNPTSGPDDHKFVYGHIWVTLAWVVRHPLWQTIGLPLRALLDVKAKDLPKLAWRCNWPFRTKLQMAVELVKWAVEVARPLEKPVWIVADGAYAYKTFLAAWPVVGGVIRVVIVREPDRWEPLFCTDPDASVETILERFADRWSIEQVFHDVKEVWGAGQQQVRNLFTNIACYHLNLWMHTLVEMWAWNKTANELCDRTRSPWDHLPRRPSHADRRNALRRNCFQNELSAVQRKHQIDPPIKKLLKTFLSLAA